MADDGMEVVRLRNDFYRDGFHKIVMALIMLVSTILLLAVVLFYLTLQKPTPIVFHTDADFRAFPLTPVDQPYVSTADLLQWVSDTLPAAFTLDFLNYQREIDDLLQYFTPTGWKKLIDLQAVYTSPKVIQDSRLYITANPAGAPYIVNQGLLSGKYAWWVQMPIDLSYNGLNEKSRASIIMQVLVVRVPTTNDLSGIAIEDIVVVKKGDGGQAGANG